MPDRRRHRGPHPADQQLFSADQVSPLQQSVSDLSWLLTREYSSTAALKLVGDRFQLVDRQRTAVMRCACSDQSLQRRRARHIDVTELSGRSVAIDGFNLITSIEAALSRGVLIQGRDGCLRDMASMHGTYRKVEETIPAITLIGQRLTEHRVSQTLWLLDRPVSNSGRLSKVIESMAVKQGWNWSTELHDNPDQELIEMRGRVIVSADSYVVENSECWTAMANDVVDNCVEASWILPLGGLPKSP